MKYCLDSNVFIEAWKRYYSFDFFPGYWKKLDQLASENIIFATEEVKKEILRVDDDLSSWLSERTYFFKPITEDVIVCLQKIFKKSESHKRLTDSSNFRSLADPWVIAHAMSENAIVVTKESYEDNPIQRIKIPNVCENMGIEYIDDFRFIRELGFKFSIQ